MNYYHFRFSLTLIDALDTLAVSRLYTYSTEKEEGGRRERERCIHIPHIAVFSVPLTPFQVFGEVEEFSSAIQKVIRDVRFDSDVIVSVFETNIRVLG